ncbi:MAG: DUF4326 domain-containing protein [Cryobacterium sp.]|nr:DUF4326 domain-containing protein [Cryobacterium sp.]
MSPQHHWRSEHPDAVIVTRTSKWGNPHKAGDDSGFYGIALDRDTAALYVHSDLIDNDGLWWEARGCYLTVNDVRAELAGRDLACWCPLPASVSLTSITARCCSRSRTAVRNKRITPLIMTDVPADTVAVVLLRRALDGALEAQHARQQAPGGPLTL